MEAPEVGGSLLRQGDGAAWQLQGATAAATQTTAPRPMTAKDLLSYARGMAAWLPAAAAATAPQPSPAPAPAAVPTHASASEPALPALLCQANHASLRPSKRFRDDGPYDICPPDMAPSTSYSGAAKAPSQRPAAGGGAVPKAVPGLPPGVVLLKGYLSLDEQIRIVRQIRELGLGPGGFYVPSYKTGGRLNLQMMCLGLHWEPRTSKYEAVRSSYDGATPPPIPPWFVELCRRCLEAASAAAATGGGGDRSRFPLLHPDICLANFYERSGRLGMHQDKDEMPDSLRAGLPVVSLSLGDAADFLYGSSRDVEAARSVRLESGDLLVFGGPARMMFHSVAKVHPNTAPPELLRATGLRPGRLNLTFRQYRGAAPSSSGPTS